MKRMSAQQYEKLKNNSKTILSKNNESSSNGEITEQKVLAYVETIKVSGEERKVTGVVLRPNVFDAQKTTISDVVIRNAAHKFLSSYNKKNTMGLQHLDFKQPIELCESAIAPVDFSFGDKTITKGTWYIVAKVNSDSLWDKVKKGELTGFSIGGKAKIKRLEKENELV
jgi:hypothetical protein